MRGRAPRLSCLLLGAAALIACQENTPVRTVALFDIRGGQDRDLFALPFPNDLRRNADGTLDLQRLGQGQIDLLQLWLDFLRLRGGGFAQNGATFFRFSQPIDPGCLPRSPEDSLGVGAAVQWVNIEPGSPEYGQRLPLRFKFTLEEGLTIGSNSLAVLPVPGFTLEPKTRYAVLLTENLCDLKGDPVQAAPDFLHLLADVPPAASELGSAHEVYRPLREFLQQQSLTGVISAAVFTSGSSTELPARARAVIQRGAAPVAEALELAEETPRTLEIRGVYQAPSFQEGTPPFALPGDGGGIRLDGNGDPVPARSERMRFALTIPRGKMPEGGWPVVLYAHGSGGDYRSFIRGGQADVLARVTDDDGREIASLAMAGIDQNLHGTRGSGDPTLAFFNLQNPTAFVHNALQSAIDDFSLLRLVKSLRISQLSWRRGAGRDEAWSFDPPLSFDPRRIYFMGHSQGAFTGLFFLPHEPEVAAAVLSGGGGSTVLELLDRTVPFSSRALLEMVLREPLDEFHPMMNLIQQVSEPAEPLNYGRLLLRHPPEGARPKHLYLCQGFDDHYVPPSTTDALATAIGLPLLGPVVRPVEGLDLRGLVPRLLPSAGNIAVGTQSVTGGLMQYRAVPMGTTCQQTSECGNGYCDSGRCLHDGHFVIYREESAIRHFSRFLATLARDGLPRLGP